MQQFQNYFKTECFLQRATLCRSWVGKCTSAHPLNFTDGETEGGLTKQNNSLREQGQDLEEQGLELIVFLFQVSILSSAVPLTL